VLDSRQSLLKKKIADELAKAQECVRHKDKRGALQCLKRKAMYEKNLETLESQCLNLEARPRLRRKLSPRAARRALARPLSRPRRTR